MSYPNSRMRINHAGRRLPGLTNELVSQVLQANPNTVIVNQSGTPVTMPWIDQASTVLQVGLAKSPL